MDNKALQGVSILTDKRESGEKCSESCVQSVAVMALLALFTIVCLSFSSIPSIYENGSVQNAWVEKHGTVVCPNWRPSLEQLVRLPGTRLHMFVIYYDARGEETVRDFTCQGRKTWITPIKVTETAKYFEHVLNTPIMLNWTQNNHTDVDYILLAGYNTVGPYSVINELSLDDSYIESMLRTLSRDFPPFNVTPMFYESKSLHQDVLAINMKNNAMVQAVTATLRAMNWTETEVQDALSTARVSPYTGSSFLVKSHTFLQVTQLMKQFLQVEENRVEFQAQDRRVSWHKPYFELHCSVLELMTRKGLSSL